MWLHSSLFKGSCGSILESSYIHFALYCFYFLFFELEYLFYNFSQGSDWVVPVESGLGLSAQGWAGKIGKDRSSRYILSGPRVWELQDDVGAGCRCFLCHLAPCQTLHRPFPIIMENFLSHQFLTNYLVTILSPSQRPQWGQPEAEPGLLNCEVISSVTKTLLICRCPTTYFYHLHHLPPAWSIHLTLI